MHRFHLFLVASIALTISQPVYSQTAYPPSTYITSGTLSKSAQKHQAGIGGVGIRVGLPRVPLGSTIGTAGDKMRSDINPVRAKTKNGLPGVTMSSYVGTPGDGIRSDLGNKPARLAKSRKKQVSILKPKKRSTPQKLQSYESHKHDVYGQPKKRNW